MKLSQFAMLLLLSSCMDQYNPRPYWQQFEQERQRANNPPASLTDTGEVPVVQKSDENQDPVVAKFTTLCSSCHGPQGGGDGAAAAGLNPKPRNFQDAKWQASVTDERIAGVIKNGGASVGLSATMVPWGNQLKDDEISKIVALIRSLKK